MIETLVLISSLLFMCGAIAVAAYREGKKNTGEVYTPFSELFDHEVEDERSTSTAPSTGTG